MSFCDNNILFSAFHDSEAGIISNETVDYIDWPSDAENAGNPLQKTLVTGLIRSPPPDIRIIFAPLDLDLEALADENDRTYALQWQRINHTLLERYDVPPDFLEERLHSACLGSGSCTYKDGSNACWLHYLCKSVDIEDGNNGDKDFPQITDHHPDKEVELHKLSQTNWTWLRAGFFLKWGPPKKRTSNGTLINPVTLLCFGASQAMKNRFGRIPNGPTLKMDIDPFQLFVIVLDELFQEMDKQVWNLSDVFRGIEHKAFIEADQTYYSTSRSKRDFAGLHNVAKYCIYLKEAFKAIDLAIEDLITEHNRLFNSDEAVKTKARLNHKRRLFKSVSLRLDSLDKRTQNILNLSFNLVAQQDNSVMLKDSKTMKAIAIVTMFFLPATSVAAICGSQFFGLDTSQSPPEIRVAGRIWIFCIVAVVMTVVVLGSWWMLNESTCALQNEKKKRWNNWLFRRQKQRKQNVC